MTFTLPASWLAPRLDGAKCVKHPELFDPHDADDRGAAEAEAAAVRLCWSCPAVIRCREWVDALPPSRRPPGVVAGRMVRRRPRNPRPPTTQHREATE